MSMRDLFLNSIDESKYMSLVYETKGNPSKITFFTNDTNNNDCEGNISENNEILSMTISNNSQSKRLNFDKNNLSINFNFIKNSNNNSSLSKLEKLVEILDLEISKNPSENYINIEELDAESRGNGNNIAKINFIDKNGEKSDFNIFIKGVY